jgi:hypothetical protein
MESIMFKALIKDRSNGNVYKWGYVDANGVARDITTYEAQWKPEKEWSHSELEALFNLSTPTIPLTLNEEITNQALIIEEDE